MARRMIVRDRHFASLAFWLSGPATGEQWIRFFDFSPHLTRAGLTRLGWLRWRLFQFGLSDELSHNIFLDCAHV